ncbi:hypothetical protein Sjap_021900 [Stephania japonica]|uniref:WAT1-related protein n=1 Tax=Stephania japonica TaxID=461633 RepID=A0AAP0HPE0_9MAGN
MGSMEKVCNILHGLKPTLLMVVVQTVFAGVNVLYKLAIDDGMNVRILVAYRYLFAAATISPLAFFLERKTRPKLTKMVVFQGLLCGLFGGALAQNLYTSSLKLTSATFASAMTNLVPGITFVMAIAFRLESLALKSKSGKAKVIGTIVGIGGAMLLTFFKGEEIKLWPIHRIGGFHPNHIIHPSHGNHVMGSLMAVGSCFSYAIWLIVQAKMVEKYPCPYSSTALMCITSSILATIFALCTDRDWSQWKVGWDIRLLTVAYTGVVATGLMVTLMAWIVRLRGPLFVSIFNPLLLILVALAGSFMLGERLYLGCALGSVLIIMGLYLVLWGKAKEEKRISQLMPSNNLKEEPDTKVVEVIVAPAEDTKSSSNKTTAQGPPKLMPILVLQSQV